MCRWLAYMGPPLQLDRLLFEPTNSLIRQSLAAQRSIVPTNGDGFGLGWYRDRSEPGVFRDTLPAWNDANLRSLSAQIQASLFFAHVRASTGASTSRENCHPFRCGETLFMHNGQIGEFQKVRRAIEQRIPDHLYSNRLGTTDSEALFLLALSHGMREDPAEALLRATSEILEIMAEHKISEPLRIAAAFTDGKDMTVVRYSSDHHSPTLYFANGGGVEVSDGRVRLQEGHDTLVVLSEPLDEEEVSWTEVPEAHLIRTDGATVIAVEDFAP
ncbi:MAG: class II glutamine amidotransferase [Rhodospirillaceae bacterium]|nr:class II glutamine amidotransferase [Rhodospirillaceae bacterium]